MKSRRVMSLRLTRFNLPSGFPPWKDEPVAEVFEAIVNPGDHDEVLVYQEQWPARTRQKG
jgi:hypothetical protein